MTVVAHGNTFKPREVAEMFDVVEATVRKWIRSGRLNATKLPGGWRITRADIAHFCNSNELYRAALHGE